MTHRESVVMRVLVACLLTGLFVVGWPVVASAQPVTLQQCGPTNLEVQGEPTIVNQLDGIYFVYWTTNAHDDTEGAWAFDLNFMSGMSGTPYNGVMSQYYWTQNSNCSGSKYYYNNNTPEIVNGGIVTSPSPVLFGNPQWNTFCNSNPGGEWKFVDQYLAGGASYPTWIFVIQEGSGAWPACDTPPYLGGPCDYHYSTPLGNHYIILSYPTNGCGTAENDYGRLGQGLRHELAETITDPHDLPAPATGWLQGSGGSGPEIGDLCQSGQHMRVQFAPTGTYPASHAETQQLWSNEANQGRGACVWTYATDWSNFYLGNDGQIWREPTNQTYAELFGRPSTPFRSGSGPAVASWAPGRIDLFAYDTNDHLGHLYQSYEGGPVSWDDWGAPPSGNFSGRPAVASWGDYRLDVFATTYNPRFGAYGVWHRSWDNGSDSGWSFIFDNLPNGANTSAPAAVSWGYGELDVFVIVNDTLYWSKSTDGINFSAWFSLGSPSFVTLEGNPAATTWGGPFTANPGNGFGQRDIFVANNFDVLSHLTLNDTSGTPVFSWDVWYPPSGYGAKPDPTATAMGDGRIFVSVPLVGSNYYAQFLQDWTATAPTGHLVDLNTQTGNSSAVVITPWWP